MEKKYEKKRKIATLENAFIKQEVQLLRIFKI